MEELNEKTLEKLLQDAVSEITQNLGKDNAYDLTIKEAVNESNSDVVDSKAAPESASEPAPEPASEPAHEPAPASAPAPEPAPEPASELASEHEPASSINSNVDIDELLKQIQNTENKGEALQNILASLKSSDKKKIPPELNTKLKELFNLLKAYKPIVVDKVKGNNEKPKDLVEIARHTMGFFLEKVVDMIDEN